MPTPRACKGHESRDTNHETRNTAFYRNTAFSRVLRPSCGEKCRLERTRSLPMVFTKHETRNTNHGLLPALPPFPIEQGKQAAFERRPYRLPRLWVTKHESRDTKHGLFSAFFRLFSNHRLDALPAIAHDCPALPTIARLPRGRMAGAPAHCGSRTIGFMDASPPSASVPFQGTRAPSGKYRQRATAVPPPPGVLGHKTRITRHETRGFCRLRATAAPTPELLGFHETRDTKHESRLFSRPLSRWERAGVRVRSLHETRITVFPPEPDSGAAVS